MSTQDRGIADIINLFHSKNKKKNKMPSTVDSRSNGFQGTNHFVCYKQISIIANIEIKEKPFGRLKNIFCYGRISTTGGSVRAGFNCI